MIVRGKYALVFFRIKCCWVILKQNLLPFFYFDVLFDNNISSLYYLKNFYWNLKYEIILGGY